MKTPLQEAINNKDLEQIQDLLGKKEHWVRNQLVAHDDHGHLPLTNAIIHCNHNISMTIKRKCEYLLLDIFHEVDGNGNTILHHLAEKAPFGMFDIVDQLIVEGKWVLNTRNNNGETPLHRAILNNSMRLYMIGALLQRGADSNISNNEGHLPLHYAMKLKRDDVINKLLSQTHNTNEFYPKLRQKVDHLDNARFNSLPKNIQSSILSFMIVSKYLQLPIDKETMQQIIQYVIYDALISTEIKYSDLEFTATLKPDRYLYNGLYRGADVYIKSCREGKDEKFIHPFRALNINQSQYITYFYGSLTEPEPCVVMQCYPQTLKKALRNNNLFVDWDIAFGLCLQLAQALPMLPIRNSKIPYYHDISGIFVTDKWKIKVWQLFDLNNCKFDVVRLPPELLSSDRDWSDTSADIYSLAICFWEIVSRCIAGRYKRPFGEEGIRLRFVHLIATTEIRPSFHPACPEGFKKLIRDCWTQSPESRLKIDEVLMYLSSNNKNITNNILSFANLILIDKRQLKKLKGEYEMNPASWDACIQI